MAHEFIIDLRPFEEEERGEGRGRRQAPDGLRLPRADDVVPVAGTLMIEPTESESKRELDRLCDALIAIREEIRAVEEGRLSKTDNPLKNAPAHRRLPRQRGGTTRHPRAGRVPRAVGEGREVLAPRRPHRQPVGDRNLACTCAPMSEYAR